MESYNEIIQKPAGGLSSVSPRELLIRYLHYLPWFLLSLAITLTIAFIRLRYSPRVYNVTGNILVKEDPNPYGGGSDKFNDIFFMQTDRSLNDEMQIIKSRNMAMRVVSSLGLQTFYFIKGNIRTSLHYATDVPFYLDILKIKDSARGFSIPVDVLDENRFAMDEGKPPLLFGQTFENATGVFRIVRNEVPLTDLVSREFIVNWKPIEKRAVELLSGLTVNMAGDATNILKLVYETESVPYGIDIVNQFMKEYQQAGLEDKKQIAVKAIRFIDQQLDTVQRELGLVEGNLRGYREKNRVYNPGEQSRLMFNEISDVETRITEEAVRLKVIDYLIRYIRDESNLYKNGVSSLGIEEPTLIVQIGEFNKLQVQRETLLKTTLPGNPAVQNIEAAIVKLRTDILDNLNNIRQSYSVAMNDLMAKSRRADLEIASIPQKEKQVLEITRRQKIMEELFSYLLQKKLETSISSASTIPNSRVIEPAIATGQPVKPNKRTFYLTAFLLGLAIPGAIIFVLEYFNDKIRGREDIEKITSAPILGEISHSETRETMVVAGNSRRFIAEQFRIIRTNLRYVLPEKEKPVLLVTSTFSGEGKSFVSVNMGAVMALTGKRTAILEFDIRKPKVLSSLNIARKNGITNYIIGNAEIDDLPLPVPGIENLFVIPCGPIPPNPAELLLSEKLTQMMAELKKRFDILIIDTAPVGLVSDAIMLGKFADASLYIVRHNYTYKKQLQLLNEIYESERLPKISLIINDIKRDGGYGNYYGYGSYGYSAYGYGSEYFDNERTTANGGWLSFKKIFRKS